MKTLKRFGRACVLMVALAAVLASPARAQQLDKADMQEIGIDPISFKGPNPQDQFKDIYIEQKLGAELPLDLTFKDETGATVKLGDYFGDKPVVLSLVYFECPMLCTLVLNGMVAGFDGQANTLDLGKDYEVVSVSIDPEETPELAASKKASYLKQYHRDGGAEGWHFLTGQEENIETLAQAVGFRYFYDPQSDQYAHASGIMICTPKGQVSSYYLGVEYLPGNLKISLIDAGAGSIGDLAKQLVLLCFHYDPTTGTYGLVIFNALRVGGGLTVLAIVAFWGVNYAIDRRRRKAGELTDPEAVAQPH